MHLLIRLPASFGFTQQIFNWLQWPKAWASALPWLWPQRGSARRPVWTTGVLALDAGKGSVEGAGLGFAAAWTDLATALALDAAAAPSAAAAPTALDALPATACAAAAAAAALRRACPGSVATSSAAAFTWLGTAMTAAGKL